MKEFMGCHKANPGLATPIHLKMSLMLHCSTL